MKSQQPVALYGGGSVSASPIARIGGLTRALGPVKASSFRVASRIANSLGAGHAVNDFGEFDRCRVVLVSVPDSQARLALKYLAEADVAWTAKPVVWCSDRLSCLDLSDLSRLGAIVSVISEVPGFDGRWLLLESSRPSRLHVCRLFAGRGVKLTAIPPGEKHRYNDALRCVGAEFYPAVKGAAHSLKHAGIPAAEASLMIQRQVFRTIESFYRSGRGAPR